MFNCEPRDTPATLTDITIEDLPKTPKEKQEATKMPVRNLIGRLWWLALTTRPDLACALHKCAYAACEIFKIPLPLSLSIFMSIANDSAICCLSFAFCRSA